MKKVDKLEKLIEEEGLKPYIQAGVQKVILEETKFLEDKIEELEKENKDLKKKLNKYE